jgi:hypothetical protein
VTALPLPPPPATHRERLLAAMAASPSMTFATLCGDAERWWDAHMTEVVAGARAGQPKRRKAEAP